MLCFSIVLGLRRLGKSAPKNGRARRKGCQRCRQNLHHAVAREQFGSQNRQTLKISLKVSEYFLKLSSAKFAPRSGARAIWKSNRWKLAWSGHFLKFKFTKFAPRCGARAIRKSKSLKLEGFGALLEVEARKICTTLWRESDLDVKIVETPGSRTMFWNSRMLFAWQAQGFRQSTT